MLWAFRKLSKRDQAVLVTAAVLFFAAFAGFLFMVMSGALFGEITFPESTLDREGRLQTYKLGAYEDLPVTITFPGTAYLIDLKGQEISGTENGALFDASDGLLIFAGTVESGSDTASFMGGVLPSLLDETCLLGTYEKKTGGEGYLNTTFAAYEGGIVTVGENEYFCMSYRYSPKTGGSRDILFGTARGRKSVSNLALKWDKTLVLDKMFMTVRKDPDGKAVLPVLDPLEETVPVNNGKESYGEPAPDGDGGDVYSASRMEGTLKGTDDISPAPEEEEMTAGEKLEETLKKQKEDEFALAYPGQEVFRAVAVVPDDLAGEEVGIDFFFINVDADIYFATARNRETGRTESASYLNDNHTGEVLFYIPGCEGGEWEIEIERRQSLGSYEVNVLKADILRDIVKTDGPD